MLAHALSQRFSLGDLQRAARKDRDIRVLLEIPGLQTGTTRSPRSPDTQAETRRLRLERARRPARS